jgi:hypothetical protein
MPRHNLFELIEDLERRAPYVVSNEHPDPLTASWLDAEADAIAAYDQWALDGDAESYAVYRAYADQADAAQDALAATGGHGLA